ncbi:MAG: hypothetical protein ACPL4I_12970 [Bacteroidota bacterium]
MLISSWRRLIPIWLLIAFSLCTSCRLFDILEGDQDKAAEIAARIGVKPSWNAIRTYLANAFQPGMSRDDVYAVFSKIGSYEIFEGGETWDPDLQDYVYVLSIHFPDRALATHLKSYIFSFDKQGKLVEFEQSDFP